MNKNCTHKQYSGENWWLDILVVPSLKNFERRQLHLHRQIKMNKNCTHKQYSGENWWLDILACCSISKETTHC
jgi:hypothetical protein